MFTAKQVSVDHKDLIHDVSYDFYGKRMATCSSDQSVKVNIASYTTRSSYIRILQVQSSYLVIVD